MMKKIVGCVLASCIALGVGANVNAASYSGQDVSAYTGDPDPITGKILTSWGTTPRSYTTVAVHPNTYSQYSDVAVKSGPVIPYGKTIVTSLPIWLNGYGASKDTFKVEDIGDINNRTIQGINRKYTRYWFDIYFGQTSGTTVKNATDFGVKTGVSYSTN